MKAPNTRTTAPEVIKIGKLLDEHCHKDPATGLAVYDAGWDDLTIAKAVNPRLVASNAASIRRATIGDLIRTRATASAGVEGRVVALEQQVADLDRRLAEFERRFPVAPQLSLVSPGEHG